MGKHDFGKLEIRDAIFEKLVNELAEINRLKRLEIRLSQGMLTARKELSMLLEDQA